VSNPKPTATTVTSIAETKTPPHIHQQLLAAKTTNEQTNKQTNKKRP